MGLGFRCLRCLGSLFVGGVIVIPWQQLVMCSYTYYTYISAYILICVLVCAGVSGLKGMKGLGLRG